MGLWVFFIQNIVLFISVWPVVHSTKHGKKSVSFDLKPESDLKVFFVAVLLFFFHVLKRHIMQPLLRCLL